VLKIDIESLELELINRISGEVLKRVRYIHLELNGPLDFSTDFFAIRKRGTVYTLRNKLFAK